MVNELQFDKEKIKRIILPELLLLSIGNKKIVIKSPELGEKSTLRSAYPRRAISIFMRL